MKIRVDTTLYAGTFADVELPVDWDQVVDWAIRWDALEYTTVDGASHSVPMHSQVGDIIDWKRPLSAEVYPISEDGEPEYGAPLATQEN